MKSFAQWCDDKNYNLEVPPVEPVKSEGSTKRAGVRDWAYPTLYSRGQYPKQSLTPTAADAVTYLSKNKE